MATSFSGGRSRSTRREPPTMGNQLVNFITCSCELSAHFVVIYKDDIAEILLKVALKHKKKSIMFALFPHFLLTIAFSGI
jgi:hypothetical protein